MTGAVALRPTLYIRLTALAQSRYASLWLFGVAFAEASVFPIPVDVLLIPLVLAQRERAWRLAAICTAGSVLGAIAGWLLGDFLLQSVGMPIVRAYHAQATLASLQLKFNQYGLAIILLKGLTPIPFKIVTLAAGAAHYPLLPFLGACIVTRGARFYLVAGLLKIFGAPIERFIETRLPLVLAGIMLLVLVGVILLRYV